MADIVNPVIVRFSNEKARVFADSLLSAYLTAKQLVGEWTANNLATIVPNATDNVVDGSENDGRHKMTGIKLHALMAAATDVIAWAETGNPSRADRLRTIAVNGQSRI